VLDGLDKLTKFHRFANVTVDVQKIALQPVLVFLGSGENHDWQKLGPLILSEAK
jgi:hypothetical protein